MKPIFLPIDLVRHSEICYEFRLDSFKVSFGEDEGQWPDPFKKQEYFEWLRKKTELDPSSVVHVWLENQIIGQIEVGAYPGEPTIGYIYLYYLKPEFRNQGYGKFLEAYAQTFFLQKGFSRGRLSVSPTNAPALHFYKKSGWTDRGPRPKQPEVRLMEKQFLFPKFQTQFYFEAHQFLDQLWTQVSAKEIDLGSWEIDHLCYRTDSNAKYSEVCKEISQFAELLIESPVNGRLISTFKLSTPLFNRGQTIDLVEVPSPKPGKMTVHGFEHIEIITEEDFQELQYRYSQLNVDSSGLKKPYNQELEIGLEGCALKFHPYSLENVIELERNSTAEMALKKSNILSILQEFHPFVAGTFPLGLGVQNSDFDILTCWSDLNEAMTILNGALSKFQNFQIERKLVDHQDTVIARFHVDQVPFEVFCQTIHPIKQRAHRHLLIEARLLKLCGSPLREAVLSYKNAGLKTEPAFAKALNLSGNPFEVMSELSELSEVELRQILNISYLS